MNVLGEDETGEVVCGDACNPGEQICHFCLTHGHRMTYLFPRD